jgi:hypothetical protein
LKAALLLWGHAAKPAASSRRVDETIATCGIGYQNRGQFDQVGNTVCNTVEKML